jgi:NADH-quinone oxidoreductase subunit E
MFSLHEKHRRGDDMDEWLREFGREQKDLIHILHKVQAEYGFIPASAIRRIAEHLGITENDVFGVLTFYKAFRLQPPGRYMLTVCQGTSCHVRGGAAVFAEIKKQLGIEPGETTADRMFSLETVNCFGCCAIGPTVVVNGTYYSQVQVADVDSLLAGYRNRK